ncbi:MAG: c-type cytochrome domain-containing protein, partial [Planctomycetaceae bacterium]
MRIRDAVWAVVVAGVSCGPVPAEEAPDFARDIRPILADHCFACHGPDAAGRQAGLRLDQREAALAPRDGAAPAIVAGEPEASALVARIHAQGEERMPPDAFGKPLTDRDRDLLGRWIAAGAPYAAHWAFDPPLSPPPPPVRR